MKKFSLLILIFVFTTAGFFGFFKSALENCADMEMREDGSFHIKAKYKRVVLTGTERLVAQRKHEKDKKACELSKKFNNNVTMECLILLANEKTDDYNSKQIKIRDVSKEENENAYKKFIKQSLKIKLKDEDYEDYYKDCTNEKKSFPDLFEAKYG